MRHLDLAGLVALAAEVSEVEGPKLLELLDCAEMEALLGEAQTPMPPQEEAAALLVGLIAIGPLPTGNQRLALLAALQFLALNGLDADLEPHALHELVAGVADGTRDATAVAAWLAPRLTARDPLEGALREALTPDAWAAIGLSLLRAYRHGRRLATPADLLMGLFREGAGPAALAMGARETDMEAADPLPTPTVPARIPAFDPESRRVLASAFRTSSVLRHHGINSGHLLLGLLDAGHAAVLPDDLDPDVIRQRVLDLVDPDVPDEGDLSGRLARLAARIRVADPEAAAELEEVADLQRMGLDRLVEMSRAWRGELFLQALARESVVVRLLGSHRLGAAAQEVMDERLLTNYLADIAQHTRLTRTEEVQLGHSVRGDAETLAAESRRRLIEANLQLVVSIARTYEASGTGMLDLIHEGNLGLMEATRHFDPTKGFRFSTYATWWIRKFILEAIARRQT